MQAVKINLCWKFRVYTSRKAKKHRQHVLCQGGEGWVQGAGGSRAGSLEEGTLILSQVNDHI